MSTPSWRDPSRPLSEEDRLYVFRRATGMFAAASERWADRAAKGMTDEELREALEREMGVGGGCGPGIPSYDCNGSGLRVWGGWGYNNVVTDRPLWQGAATVAMARKVYGIRQPVDPRQFSLGI